MDIVESPRVRWPSDDRVTAHGVVFSDPHQSVVAAATLRQDGYDVVEAFTPFAVQGMDVALGMRETRLGWGALVGGCVGALLGFGFPVWTHAVSWPLNIGGKTFVAWQAIVPVTFEVIVLFAAFATLGVLFVASRLRPTGKQGKPPRQPSPAVTDDRVVLVVAERDGSFEARAFEERCNALGAEEVIWSWRPGT